VGRLDGKVALITGAGGGMGRVATQVFVREGARVVAVDVKAEAVQETVGDLGDNAVAATGDVTRDADVQRIIRTAVDRFGSLNVLYNNAGVFDQADESVLTLCEQFVDRPIGFDVSDL